MKSEWTEKSEFPFDSAIKRMSVIFQHEEKGSWVFLKGAVERVLEVCTNVKVGDEDFTLDELVKEQVLREMEKFASLGLVFSHKVFTNLACVSYCTSTMDGTGR
jgi:magnesium-transporting ATPase (P-type)